MPLRGGKFSNFEGGIRTLALVAGGALPAARRGAVDERLVAAWDWYATFAGLVGLDPTDARAAAPRVTAAFSTSPLTRARARA